ncbi:MAG: ammonium transporter, partial [Dehalococcoidia bacterium]
ITGAFAERAKFSTFMIFSVVWVTVVYAPVAHWVWGQGGWLQSVGLGEGGALDFAGGTVVHINAGVAALAAALIFGRRIGFGREPMEPHNVSMVVLGAVLLWFGWFGFNAGSALAADGLATNAFVVTHVATATAALTWVGLSWLHRRKPSVVGAATGAVAGLVAITPAAGFIGAWPGATDGYLNSMPAIIIGMGAGIFTYLAVQLRIKLRLDDSLDVWGVHGIGGTWGAFATGLFAVAAIGGGAGLIDGDAGQLSKQLAGIGATWGYSFVATLIILKVLDVVLGVRVTEEEELVGVDIAVHGERSYVFDFASPGAIAEVEAGAAAAGGAANPQPLPQPGTATSKGGGTS